jgi:hypothetical protein
MPIRPELQVEPQRVILDYGSSEIINFHSAPCLRDGDPVMKPATSLIRKGRNKIWLGDVDLPNRR